MKRHIALLGDSIFDNALYVPGGPSVTDHLRRLLDGDRVTLIAVDGATVSSVFRQVERIPDDATHLVLSVGGNDALWMSGNILSQQVDDVRSSLRYVAEVLEEFSEGYRRLVRELAETGIPLITCTIYDSIPGLDTSEVAGLSFFNDTIIRTAVACRTRLIDLRAVCSQASDYSAVSPIEPSAAGGGKIARAVAQAVLDDCEACRVIGC